MTKSKLFALLPNQAPYRCPCTAEPLATASIRLWSGHVGEMPPPGSPNTMLSCPLVSLPKLSPGLHVHFSFRRQNILPSLELHLNVTPSEQLSWFGPLLPAHWTEHTALRSEPPLSESYLFYGCLPSHICPFRMRPHLSQLCVPGYSARGSSSRNVFRITEYPMICPVASWLFIQWEFVKMEFREPKNPCWT